jgi:hypothetical protein
MPFRSRTALGLLAACLLAAPVSAQQPAKIEFPRPSPHATFTQTVGLTDITIAYSSPAVRGRKIWGDVVRYDTVWRAGANECTKVTFSKPATVGGKPVPAGSSCLFLLPTKTGWTLILNKDTTLAGSDGYKESGDLLRVPATVTTIPLRERLAYQILDFNDDGGTLALEWDTLRIAVKFETGTRAALLAEIRALKTDDWKPYNSAARYLLDAKLDPAYAMELVDRSIKLQEDWFNVWTKAELLHAAGKTQEAIADGQRAQALGAKSQNFFFKDEIVKWLADWQKK